MIGYNARQGLDPNSEEMKQARLAQRQYLATRCHYQCECKLNLERKLVRNTCEREKLERQLAGTEASHSAKCETDQLSCVSCGKLAMEMYIVHDDVWASAGFNTYASAHYKCLERALGRPIQLEDLTHHKCNDMIRHLIRRQ